MKNLILLPALVILLFVTSCVKNQHNLRVENNMNRIVSVTVGPANFGLVGINKTTDYQTIPEGDNACGGDLYGNVSVTGKGTHNWKMTINANGTLSIKEDK